MRAELEYDIRCRQYRVVLDFTVPSDEEFFDPKGKIAQALSVMKDPQVLSEHKVDAALYLLYRDRHPEVNDPRPPTPIRKVDLT